MTGINSYACFFIVSLRLVIGWHFLIEGLHKIHTHYVGKTATNTPWTGAGFFREGYGPAAATARNLLELDESHALARFRAAESSARANDWDGYLSRFAAHFTLTPDQTQAAAEILKSSKSATEDWIAGKSPSTVKKSVAWGAVDVPMTVPERIKEIEARLKDVEDTIARKLPAFNADVEKARLRTLKLDAARAISDLTADYESRVAEFRSSLDKLLTADQKKLAPPSSANPQTTRIEALDKLTMWSHVIMGGMLLVGLFSRTASLGLALFLVSITLIAPAVPFAPTPPGAIGHYLYVNLYTIEMVALFALACIPTGRWFGLDALLAGGRSRSVYLPGPVLLASPRRS
ncbi:MAG: DoxX family membrane protein [Gemmataceae bacterium]|nr:DoxX family membrane protein [Gemmataceae bacterium]